MKTKRQKPSTQTNKNGILKSLFLEAKRTKADTGLSCHIGAKDFLNLVRE